MPRQFNGGKDNLQQRVMETARYAHRGKKMNLNPNFISYTKIYPNWFTDLNVRVKL